MEVIDEKVAGVPPMEVDEVVSVHDRTFIYILLLSPPLLLHHR
jgi:hypothetical protein